MKRGLAVAVLSALLATTACGGDDASADDDDAPTADEAADLLGPEDVASGDPVRIGFVSDGATPALDNTDELRAAEATVEYWNTHHGGVDGRPVELVTCETGGDPAGGTDCGTTMVQEDVVAVALSQSSVGEALYEPLHQAGLPTFFFQNSTAEMLADDETSFVTMNPLAGLFVIAATAEENDVDKVTFVTIDIPPALAVIESEDTAEILEDAGLDSEIVAIPMGTPDLTSQMREVADTDPGVVHVVGNDAFCIAAFQGLAAVGYDGPINTIDACITDATRDALAGGLEGLSVGAVLALGDEDDPAYRLYEAVMATYGPDVEDVDNALGMGAYTTMASLLAALGGAEGELTPETAAETIRTMPETDYPGADGLTFRCGGSAFPSQPAVCTNQSLRTILDADGNPTTYEPIDATGSLEGS